MREAAIRDAESVGKMLRDSCESWRAGLKRKTDPSGSALDGLIALPLVCQEQRE